MKALPTYKNPEYHNGFRVWYNESYKKFIARRAATPGLMAIGCCEEYSRKNKESLIRFISLK